MFKWLVKIFKKIFKAIMKILKKIWPLLLIAAIVIAVFFPAVIPLLATWMSTALATMGGWVASAATWFIGLFEGLTFGEGVALALGAAFLLDPESTGKAVGNVVSEIGDAVTDVASGVSGAVADSLFSSPLALIAGAGLLIYFLSSSESEDENPAVMRAQADLISARETLRTERERATAQADGDEASTATSGSVNWQEVYDGTA